MENIALYIHWPFCKSKCPYCDFNSHVAADINQEQWLNAYLLEIDHYAEFLKNKRISSIFFGGGTPSLMPVNTVEKILDRFSSKAVFSNNVEITLEANPTSIEMEKFKGFKQAGINRVSIGVQSFIDEDLKFLGREHSADEAKKALKTATHIFDNYSFDLIYARPGQNVSSWKKELEQAMEYASNHMSLYQLTIEKGTPFYASYKNKKFELPDQDLASELYEVTEDHLEKHGLRAYEVSNYAKPGFESAHNLAYWRYDQYLGIGPGAHSRIEQDGTLKAIVMQHSPQKWLSDVMSNKKPIQQCSSLKKEDMAVEAILMGLRIVEGIKISKLEAMLGMSSLGFLNIKNIQNLVSLGYVVYDSDNLAVTKNGRLVLNKIVELVVEKDDKS